MLGDRIKAIRCEREMSQQALADKLNVTRQTISSWEDNRTEPSMDNIRKFVELLKCSVAELTDIHNGAEPIRIQRTTKKLSALQKKIHLWTWS